MDKILFTTKEEFEEFERDNTGRLPLYGNTNSYLDNPDTFNLQEKQEEQKPNIELIQRTWYMEGYQDREHNLEPEWIVKTGEGGPRYEENPKYGQMLEEQKPIPKFKVGDRIYDKRDSYNRNVIREVGKDYYINAFAQKMDMVYTDANFEFLEHLDNDPIAIKSAEWSEEDEKKIIFLERLIRYNVPEGQYGYMGESVTKLQAIAMLKSLRPQPKQELSEEDERILKGIIGKIDHDQTLRSVKGRNAVLLESYSSRLETQRGADELFMCRC